MKTASRLSILLAFCFAGAPLAADEWTVEELLPPAPPWAGKSLELIVEPDHPWITPAERTGLETTPDHAETLRWLDRLVDASARFQRVDLGESGAGRELVMIVASAEGAGDPEALRENGKPTVLAQAGIHAGEIDGKDAGLMLLRDMLEGGRNEALLEQVNFLFIPIFNVDGHERASPFGRVNQRGPRQQGWRTNANNLNLNRDYAKADTLELRALLQVLNLWRPDLYLDLHVTDGIDYQYDVTYGWHGVSGWSPAISNWLTEHLRPAVDAELRSMGHIPGPLIFAMSNSDLDRGIVDWMAGPRFSHGYGDARQLPAILVENHSLKPYPQRVLGTYVLLESMLRLIGQEGQDLRKAIEQDRARRMDPIPLSFKAAGSPDTIEFLGIASSKRASEITGGEVVEWLGTPVTRTIPYVHATAPGEPVQRPRAYWIPPAWREVLQRLELHGIRLERQDQPRTLDVERYLVTSFELGRSSFEGRVRVEPRELELERVSMTFPAGSVRVPLDQPLGTLAVLLLEPRSADSFFQWGFFHPVLQRTEYAESYVLEPLARRMLAADPELKQEFQARLKADAEFAGNPRARLQWFYDRSPFVDRQWKLYPVAREP